MFINNQNHTRCVFRVIWRKNNRQTAKALSSQWFVFLKKCAGWAFTLPNVRDYHKAAVLTIRGSQYRNSYHIRAAEPWAQKELFISGLLCHPSLRLCLPLVTVLSVGEVEKDAVLVHGAWTTESYGRLNCTGSLHNTQRSTHSEVEILV